MRPITPRTPPAANGVGMAAAKLPKPPKAVPAAPAAVVAAPDAPPNAANGNLAIDVPIFAKGLSL